MANLHFSDEALGWLKETTAPSITFIAILIGLGHALLAMSGEESLAQVYREIEAPKHKNLLRAGLVIFLFSLVFTSLVSFFAVMIIPEEERSKYFDNLIGGLSMFLAVNSRKRSRFNLQLVSILKSSESGRMIISISRSVAHS
jgi:Amino acid permease